MFINYINNNLIVRVKYAYACEHLHTAMRKERANASWFVAVSVGWREKSREQTKAKIPDKAETLARFEEILEKTKSC